MKDKPTIIDVAQKAGVSIATVSRIINDKNGQYNEKTKERVIKAIRELNYQPNVVARGLRSQKTHTVGFVVSELEAFFVEVLEGAQSVARKKGYSAFLCNTDYNVKQEENYVVNLLERRVDGVIFIGGIMNERHIVRLRKEDIPVVLVEKFIEKTDVPSVGINNVQAAKKAVQHLLRLGHRKIGFISTPFEIVPMRERFKGYRQALMEESIPYDSSIVYIEETIGEKDITPGYRLMQKILRGRNVPHAFFITSDAIAIAVIKAIKNFGMEVPDDIALVGFDDIEMASYSDPPLTTVAQPKYQMGAEGMQLLIKLMNGVKVRKKEIELETHIVIRDSCGEVKKKARI